MGLGPTEFAVMASAAGRLRGGSFAGRLGPVMPPAERSEVGLAVVVTGPDVVYVGGGLDTAHAVLISGCAAMAVPDQDAASELRPVRRQAKPSVRRSPGHQPPTSGMAQRRTGAATGAPGRGQRRRRLRRVGAGGALRGKPQEACPSTHIYGGSREFWKRSDGDRSHTISMTPEVPCGQVLHWSHTLSYGAEHRT